MTEPQVIQAGEVVCELRMSTDTAGFADYIRRNRQYCRGPRDVVQPDSHKGQSVAICGAGWSLTQHEEQLRNGGYDQIWGCNSALPYLWDAGLPVTHGITVDQGEDMLKPVEFGRTLNVPYYLASSVHPLLAKKLARMHRQLTWFHNFVGMENPKDWVAPEPWASASANAQRGFKTLEMWLYETQWPSTVQVGYGLNTLPRSAIVAMFMGFARIDLYGADHAAKPDAPPMPAGDAAAYSAWLKQVVLYATGRTVHAAYGDTAIMIEHYLGGHRWHTRPDMMISARHLIDLARMCDGKQVPITLRLIGDTLPNAMLQMGQEYLDTMPQLKNGSVHGFTDVAAPPPFVTAVRWEGDNWEEVRAVLDRRDTDIRSYERRADHLHLETLNGPQVAAPGDWIVRNVRGIVSTMTHAAFFEEYKPVDSPQTS